MDKIQDDQILADEELLATWVQAVSSSTPHAAVRMGDKETCVAAHGTILTMEFIRYAYPWVRPDSNYPYGSLPDADMRRELVDAFRAADEIGILTQYEFWGFRPLAEMVVDNYQLRPSAFFYAFANAYICKRPSFYEAFQDTPTLLVGSQADNYREVLERRYGWSAVVGTVDCPRWQARAQAREEMDQFDYDLAIICAGVPAVTLAHHAKKQGRVGLDLGSAADTCVQADLDGCYAWEWDQFPDYV